MIPEYATCAGSECGSAGTPVMVLRTPDTPVVCGVCGQPITDLTETPPELPTEVPSWLD